MEIIPDTKIGQHFLVDKKILEFIANLPQPNSSVVEIGAGDGRLTELLVNKAKQLIAVEIDSRYFPVLKRLEQKNRNLKVVFQDFLRFDLARANIIGKSRIDLVGSLPYHIVEPLFHKITKWPIRNAYFVVGLKLLQELQADINSDIFGKLTLFVQSIYHFDILQSIPKSAFDPPPPTPAVIIKFTPRNTNEYRNDFTLLALKLFFESGQRGTKVKNILKEAIIKFSKYQNILCTQNEARSKISGMKISTIILEKSFEQLSNNETKIIYSQLISCKISPSSKT